MSIERVMRVLIAALPSSGRITRETETVCLYPKTDDKNLMRLSNMKAVACPLCELDLENEKIYYQDKSFIVLRTKTLKGHRERIMIVYRQHEHTIPYKAYEHALDLISKIGRKVFSYTPKFAILDTTFATINDHWHLVATDLDPKSEDFNQILATRWIRVIDNTTTEEIEI